MRDMRRPVWAWSKNPWLWWTMLVKSLVRMSFSTRKLTHDIE